MLHERHKTRNLVPAPCEVYYYPEVFSTAESEKLYTYLLNKISWKQEPIKIFGKPVMQPRLTAWYGEDGKNYRYSGTDMHPAPWNDGLLTIKKSIEKIAGVQFSGVLLNYYRNGQDSMGWHRDNEKMLGAEPIVASVSFGATRRFELRKYAGKDALIRMDLEAGSLLLMRGQTQHIWEHRLPKTTKQTAGRINCTFRIIS